MVNYEDLFAALRPSAPRGVKKMAERAAEAYLYG